MKQHDAKRNRSLEHAREAAEAQLHTPKAALANKASKAMVSSLVPIHERFQKVIEDRKNHIASLREARLQLKSDRESAELSFTPKICPSPRRRMTPEKFYQYTEEWAETAKKRTDSFRELIQTKEMKEVTFKPKINQSPLKGGEKFEVRTAEDLKNREKRRKKLEKALTPTFSPKITKAKDKETRLETAPTVLPEPAVPPSLSSLSTFLHLLSPSLPPANS